MVGKKERITTGFGGNLHSDQQTGCAGCPEDRRPVDAGKAVHPGSVALYPTLTDISYMSQGNFVLAVLVRRLNGARLGFGEKARCVLPERIRKLFATCWTRGFPGFFIVEIAPGGLEYLLVTSEKNSCFGSPFRTSQEWLPDLHEHVEHTWSILTKPRSHGSWVVAVGRNLGRGEPFGELLSEKDVQEFRRSILAHGLKGFLALQVLKRG